MLTVLRHPNSWSKVAPRDQAFTSNFALLVTSCKHSHVTERCCSRYIGPNSTLTNVQAFGKLLHVYLSSGVCRWAWCLPCGFRHIVPFFYVIYFGTLLGEDSSLDVCSQRACLQSSSTSTGRDCAFSHSALSHKSAVRFEISSSPGRSHSILMTSLFLQCTEICGMGMHAS